LRVHDASRGGGPPALPRFLPVWLGAVSWLVPSGLVGEVLGQARLEAGPAAAARRLRLLPPVLGVYFTLGLCLFSHLAYREVLGGLAGAPPAPASTALTGLRRRLGPRPFELLFARVAGHLSPGTAPWSHACGLLLAAWDGTTLAVPASEGNMAWAGGRSRAAHYPRARLVALAACGSRCLIAAAAGPFRTGERALAATLTGHLRPGMLLLADRGFYSWGLWHAAAATGAHLLWRVKAGTHLPVTRVLPDGSWLTRIDDPYQKQLRWHRATKNRMRRAGRPPESGPLPGALTVRVIEFTVTVTGDDGTARTERYRMITTLLDCRAAPAAELATAYARRWAIETCFCELKARLRGPGRVLRSRTPDLVLQETWAYLVTYQAIRAVIARTAAGAGLDPARLSFTTALTAIRATAGRHPADALASADAAILAVPVPARPGRVRPRALREPAPAYPAIRRTPGPIPRHAAYTITITTPTTPTHTPGHQHKHPTSTPNLPP
jgi:DDE family transposase/transposase IS4-like protein